MVGAEFFAQERDPLVAARTRGNAAPAILRDLYGYAADSAGRGGYEYVFAVPQLAGDGQPAPCSKPGYPERVHVGREGLVAELD